MTASDISNMFIPESKKIAAVFMRGGTSKGVFFSCQDI
jgi:2-methylaconitate cis-trans-isomerase PrpF